MYEEEQARRGVGHREQGDMSDDAAPTEPATVSPRPPARSHRTATCETCGEPNVRLRVDGRQFVSHIRSERHKKAKQKRADDRRLLKFWFDGAGWLFAGFLLSQRIYPAPAAKTVVAAAKKDE